MTKREKFVYDLRTLDLIIQGHGPHSPGIRCWGCNERDKAIKDKEALIKVWCEEEKNEK